MQDLKYQLSKEQDDLYNRLEQSRRNGTGLIFSDPASVGILHQLITDLLIEINNNER